MYMLDFIWSKIKRSFFFFFFFYKSSSEDFRSLLHTKQSLSAKLATESLSLRSHQ